jgi:cell division protein FtsL
MTKQTGLKKRYTRYNDYVQGNAVRKVSTVELPLKEPRTYVGNERVTTTRETYRNREKALRMSLSYVMVLGVCCLVLMAVCVRYLSLQDSIATKKADIVSLESKINTLKSRNDALDYSVNSFMDIEHITKVAMEELGMIRATEHQISFYNNTENEYMKQFKDIPTEK